MPAFYFSVDPQPLDGEQDMRVALLSKYSRLGASSRLRSLQYLPVLERMGIRVTPYPLFDDTYLRRLYEGKGRSLLAMARRYAVRIRRIHGVSDIDLIWLEYEALPYLPFWLEKALFPSRVPYVVDYDDAVFHNYDLSGNPLVRWLLGHKIDRVMAGAATVICGNDYLANRARQAGAAHVENMPTVVDADRYKPMPESGNDVPVIGWIGSPATQDYVLELRPVFERLHRTHGIQLLLVGARPDMVHQFGSVPVEVLSWSEATEAENVARIGIGIMPLADGPWERGKCGYKLIQYMACAKPVVASAVGMNVEIVKEWQCGKLADGLAQWDEALSGLLSDRGKCHSLGMNGRMAVEQHYSLQAQVSRLADILRRAASVA